MITVLKGFKEQQILYIISVKTKELTKKGVLKLAF